MVSPLSKVKSAGIVEEVSYVKPSSSPLVKAVQSEFTPPTTSVNDESIEQLGSQLSRAVGQTTEKIVSKMSVASFEDLGSILVDVQSEANKLDPNSIQKRGVVGWFQRRFGDIKKELTVRLKNADAVFNQLESKLSKHITVHTEWVSDLENLYEENIKRFNEIEQVIATANLWEQVTKEQINNWEEIKPDDTKAAIKLQAKADAQARLKRIQIKKDNFIRWKAIVESNGPQIRSQQETSRVVIMTLKDVIDQTIPMIKMEFTKFIQSLDAKKSIQLVDSARQLSNTTLTRSADSAKQAAIGAATALSTPLVETATLNHIRNRMLETLSEVATIDEKARLTREQDRVAIEQSQQQYLAELTKAKAI